MEFELKGGLSRATRLRDFSASPRLGGKSVLRALRAFVVNWNE
jgi:hypothetical protein